MVRDTARSKRIKELYQNGISTREIAKILVSEGEEVSSKDDPWNTLNKNDKDEKMLNEVKVFISRLESRKRKEEEKERKLKEKILAEFNIKSQVSIDHDLIQNLFDYLIQVIEVHYVPRRDFFPSFEPFLIHNTEYLDWFKITVTYNEYAKFLDIFHGKYRFDGTTDFKWGNGKDPPLVWHTQKDNKWICNSIERLQIYNEILQEGRKKDNTLILKSDLLNDDTSSIREAFHKVLSTIRKMITLNAKNEVGMTEQLVGLIRKPQSSYYLRVFSGLEWIPLTIGRINNPQNNLEHIHNDSKIHEFKWGTFRLAINLALAHIKISRGNFEEENTWLSENPDVNLEIQRNFESFLQEIEKKIMENPIHPIISIGN